ncbi:PilZ domain-containing protein [Sphingomonas sp. ERG5]|uniref:PilZ domain-containing protein n=1 Tax=Sphingomonas sp. ERG5 TaxID=1381597 RepID=UPI001364C4D0|nr:PilZ domain-containing protein [Sphingomonas sp. ERG5]
MINTGVAQQQGAGQRSARRLKTFQVASMHIGDDVRRVHLLNLSTTGAMVHASDPPAKGASCRLDAAIDLGSAHVTWVSGQRFGVMFDRPLSDASLAILIDGTISNVSAGPGIVSPSRRIPAVLPR